MTMNAHEIGRKALASMGILLSMGTGFWSSTVLLGAPASAVACLGSPYNTTAEPDTNGRGVQVSSPGMLIENKTVDCGRVSSLFDKNSADTRWVEVGWYEDQSVYVCIPSTTNPWRLAFASLDGVNSCFIPSGGIGEGTDGFKVHDDNQDGIWKFSHEATNFWNSPDMGTFVTGTPISNGERVGTSDPAHSDFNGLKRMNSSQVFVNWSGTHERFTSDDPDYKLCVHSATHVEVKLNSNPC
jgi:hypothetical protein